MEITERSLEREFDFKQVLMGTAYVEGYTGALGLALILVSIICIYITPFLMILLVPLALAYVCAVIYVAVILLSRIMNVEPLTVGAVYVVLFIINLYITGLCAYYLRNYMKNLLVYTRRFFVAS